tara:strand:- start:1363 stop:1986 length:624 start_codon:yes stop_codon:yes gene_type:complete
MKKNKCSYLIKSIVINSIEDYYNLVELHKKEPENSIWGKIEIKENKVHGNKKIDNIDLKCKFCNNIFSRLDNLKRHYITCNKKKEYDDKIKDEKLKKEQEILQKKLLDIENKDITSQLIEIKKIISNQNEKIIKQNEKIIKQESEIKLLNDKINVNKSDNLSIGYIPLESEGYKCPNCDFTSFDDNELNLHLHPWKFKTPVLPGIVN